MLPFYSIFSIFFVFVYPPLFLAIGRPSLSRFYLECVQQARQFADRSFHSLVTLQHLATWGLGPEMSVETLAHEFTTRRRKLFTLIFFSYLFEPSYNIFFLYRDSNYKRKQRKGHSV